MKYFALHIIRTSLPACLAGFCAVFGVFPARLLAAQVSPASGAYQFEKTGYNPAILAISFTDQDSANALVKGRGNSFLDISLITRQAEPEGRRVEVTASEFQALLRGLYSQLAKQEPLNESNPLSPSRRLYDLLIKPVASELRIHRVTTLLISVERGLQAVPFAALHSGQSFFGDEYSFSITPSLQLTSLAPRSKDSGDALLAGAAAFPGLAPLPLVPQELNAVSQSQKSRIYLDQAFTPNSFLTEASSSQYDRIHIATHAEFLPGGPSKSILYTGGGPMPMNNFAQIRQRRQDSPLDLVTLSACRTALGDSESELGFAGLALQAGSRSAIGTLWYVDDVATSAFFIQFYHFLDKGFPKAEALKATRIAMQLGAVRLDGNNVLGVNNKVLLSGLTESQRRRISSGLMHPFYWSGIELIGTPW